MAIYKDGDSWRAVYRYKYPSIFSTIFALTGF